ncbi:amidase family protein [Tepidibacter hydrothermalis]|uniref:Amidase family protein n=1 Tax=Tepidibacter hydrothermalis TaxID=3036126 RepID=A0ABY8EJ44_9FIRM|nr:amidase family protein [Tepidibacter hydrothermalis]WFD10933.1 amidase family protein [Tepidibacter hydrothermalis]
MKIWKKVLIVMLAIILIGALGVGGFIYYKLKAIMPDTQIEAQVQKQYIEEVKTSSKKTLDFSPFEKYMGKISDERYKELEKLLLDSDVAQIQEGFENKVYSVEEVTCFYLKRIQKYDNKLNTIIELNPDSIEIARALDKELDKGNINGKLFGIPVLLKDNIGTKDKMHNTAGAKALENSKSDKDAFIVSKIRKSNGIILGKANLSEWANFMSFDSSNGYSALGGQTHNPYGKFDVGGSSSGSAASVAANLTPISVGSETAGSMIYPSSQNSVVGIKPSLGLLSRDRIIPIAEAQDTAGTIGKSVKDATILFNELVGYDINDVETEKAKEYENIDYTKFLEKDGLKGMKIGLVVDEGVVGRYRNEDKEILDKVVQDLKNLGAEVKEVELGDEAFNINYMNVLLHGYKNDVNQYLKNIGSNDIKTIEDVVKFNKEDLENRAAYGQGLIEMAQEKNFTDEEIKKEIENNRKVSGEAIDKVLKDNDIEVLLTLSNYISGVYAPAGYPAITVPAGYRESGEPLGITLVASKFEEEKLIKAAYSYEQGTKKRKEPDMIVE